MIRTLVVMAGVTAMALFSWLTLADSAQYPNVQIPYSVSNEELIINNTLATFRPLNLTPNASAVTLPVYRVVRNAYVCWQWSVDTGQCDTLFHPHKRVVILLCI